MSFERKWAGKVGEEAAASYLQSIGYKIIERNFSNPHSLGELDLIAREKDTLVFVEVKTFTHDWAEGPVVNITPEKKRRIIRAARAYLAGLGRDNFCCRFDVVTVNLNAGAEIEHFVGAFEA